MSFPKIGLTYSPEFANKGQDLPSKFSPNCGSLFFRICIKRSLATVLPEKPNRKSEQDSRRNWHWLCVFDWVPKLKKKSSSRRTHGFLQELKCLKSPKQSLFKLKFRLINQNKGQIYHWAKISKKCGIFCVRKLMKNDRNCFQCSIFNN